MLRIVTLMVTGLALALLAACQPPAQLLVEKAYVKLSPVEGSPSVLYFTIKGGPSDTVLRSITSPNILRLEMHETVEENGMSTMQPITAVAVPTRGKVEFEPGGKHVMVWGFDNASRKAGKATFLFSFSNGEKIEVDATLNAIKPEDGMAHH
ncbi:copper chaperone PCu(A)C [Blastomonas sp. CCH5-A3]|uniref:copper chaperone PCu(A)C n=1 Tax=Blastomonas sp. CCH5-A3 TaxID=1768761 RepID=UPI001922A3AC|nr:copper chaperone PCu(A)C [Blastomonas sp. CCH5-A3]